jgi:hypothetical protein
MTRRPPPRVHALVRHGSVAAGSNDAGGDFVAGRQALDLFTKTVPVGYRELLGSRNRRPLRAGAFLIRNRPSHAAIPRASASAASSGRSFPPRAGTEPYLPPERFPVGGKVRGGAQQHGDMPVVATSVHPTRNTEEKSQSVRSSISRASMSARNRIVFPGLPESRSPITPVMASPSRTSSPYR